MAQLEVGSQLELAVDPRWIDQMDGVRLVLHAPVAREIVLPGDGNSDHFPAAGGKRRLHGSDFVDDPPWRARILPAVRRSVPETGVRPWQLEQPVNISLCEFRRDWQ